MQTKFEVTHLSYAAIEVARDLGVCIIFHDRLVTETTKALILRYFGLMNLPVSMANWADLYS